MKRSLYILAYSAVLGTVCAALLTGVAGATAERREANQRADKIRNILSVLEIEYDENASPEQLDSLFAEAVEDKSSGDIELYKSKAGVNPNIVAVGFEGQGLWGPIKGYLAVDTKTRRVAGMTIYEQEETPGLGGEIGNPDFQGRFVGRRFVGPVGKAGIVIVREGAPVAENEIQGISGATVTSGKLQQIINQAIERLMEEMKANG